MTINDSIKMLDRIIDENEIHGCKCLTDDAINSIANGISALEFVKEMITFAFDENTEQGDAEIILRKLYKYRFVDVKENYYVRKP